MNVFAKGGLVFATIAVLASPCRIALADEPWPSHAIKLVVPFSAGGPSDSVGRLVADGLSRALGQPVVVENRPGAGASIGAAFVAHAKPDGYTLMLGHAASVSATPQMRKVEYDQLKDFQPIAGVSRDVTIITARKDFPANDLAGLKALATKKPDAVSCATAGQGSQTHVSCGALADAMGAKFLIVHYRGTNEARNDLLAGRVDISFDPTGLPWIRNGSLKVLGTLDGEGRFREVPNVASLVEQGYPSIHDTIWFGVLAPAGTPQPIVDRIAAALKGFVSEPVVAERLLAQGQTPNYIGPADLKRQMVEDTAYYRGIIDKLGMHE